MQLKCERCFCIVDSLESLDVPPCVVEQGTLPSATLTEQLLALTGLHCLAETLWPQNK